MAVFRAYANEPRMPPARFGVQVRRRSLFGVCVLLLLVGYAFLGKGFAYLGIPPLFIGEAVLAFGLCAFLYRFHSGVFRSSVSWLVVLFIAWGALRTVPYLDLYGLDALRDGVVWGYAIYALAVATVLIRFKAIAMVVDLYGRAGHLFLILAPVIVAVCWFAEEVLPRWPWGAYGGIPIVDVKAGDMAVHYAGLGAFALLGLAPSLSKGRSAVLWCLGVLPVIFVSRSAFVTIACVLLLLTILRPTFRYSVLIAAGLAALLVLYVTGLEIDPGFASGRVISVSQFVDNIASILFPEKNASLDLAGTRMWRELWWNKIAEYTFFGEYFWQGRGFGINLADADGFQTDGNLRSPHNGHLTILARMGVPGLVIWISLNLVFATALLRNFLNDRRAGREWLARVELWTLSYWLAFTINTSFDVFLEGPQGGIWFWSVMGFGLALIVVRPEAVKSASVQPSRAPHAAQSVRGRPARPGAGAVWRR